MEKETKKKIYELLNELKWKGEAFNQMGGELYSRILADEMTKINHELRYDYGVKVEFWQPRDGRVAFVNLDELIKKYDPEVKEEA